MPITLSRAITIAALVQITTTFMAAQAAVLRPQEHFKPTGFTATCWSDDSVSSGVHLYIPTKDGDIQELLSNPSQPGSEWMKESVLHDANFALNKETPLASTTLNGVTRLYFYDSNSSLREWIYDGGWYVGSLSHPVNGFGRPLSAISWMEGETPNVSVFYGEAAGGLFEASKSGDGEWSINTIGPARGALSIWARAWFHGNVLQKRLYYQDNAISKQIRESTWNVMQSSPKNAWSPHSETNGFPLKPSKGMSFGGFVLSSGNEHIIVNPPGTTQIVEYLRGGPRPSQFWKEEPTTLAARTRADSPIAVTHCVVDKKDTAFVFYLGLSGELEQISYSNEWSTYSSVVAVFL